jgi:glyoxylase-like metal-dependent hydrolase (beta-lactamase superfamily II)
MIAGPSFLRGACHAWVQSGGWGVSNTGLIAGDGESLLVDTLFDLAHTRRMLDGLAAHAGHAPIGTVVNTHGNGDHWFGNELVPDVEIVAAAGSIEDMRAVRPRELTALLAAPGRVGEYARDIFGAFRFDDLTPALPTRSFDDRLELTVGGVDVELIDVGPAHTRGDTIVHCPRDGVVYVGDIVFAGGTPIVWAGPVGNWIDACERILGLGADILVPGHGPVSPVEVVRTMVDYLDFVRAEGTSRWSAGMPLADAAADVDLGLFAGLPESERLALNLAAVYRELDPEPGPPPDGPALFGCMADFRAIQRMAGLTCGG